MTDLAESLAEAFTRETDSETAEAAARQVAEFAEEYDEDLDAETVLALLEEAPYDAFVQRFNWAVGDLAAENEDCTDSRPFRIDGFGDLAADPDVAA